MFVGVDGEGDVHGFSLRSQVECLKGRRNVMGKLYSDFLTKGWLIALISCSDLHQLTITFDSHRLRHLPESDKNFFVVIKESACRI
jgi:hypothetical protein